MGFQQDGGNRRIILPRPLHGGNPGDLFDELRMIFQISPKIHGQFDPRQYQRQRLLGTRDHQATEFGHPDSLLDHLGVVGQIGFSQGSLLGLGGLEGCGQGRRCRLVGPQRLGNQQQEHA